MTPKQFSEIAKVLPEPSLLITSEGEILAGNKSGAKILGLTVKELGGQIIFNLVTAPRDEVVKYLQACSKSRNMVLGSFNFLQKNGKIISCRLEGAVVEPTSVESPALIFLRLKNRDVATQEFVLLNNKIDELAKEIHQRQKAQAALSQSNQELKITLENLEVMQKTQVQLIQAEKMSSLQKMIAGIAHEINNPLSFIQGNITPIFDYVEGILCLLNLYQKMVSKTPEEIEKKIEELELDFILEDLPKAIKSMQVGTMRIKEIVRNLRIFSRLDEAEIKAVDLHENISSTLIIVGSRLKGNAEKPEVQVIKDYGDLPRVECYPGQLNQVFLNIIINALDALETSEVAGSEAGVNNQGNLGVPPSIFIKTERADGDRVRITISDNGPGISEAILNKLFDPFFTTKPVGKGTGLGLAISYEIITEKHRGKLWCESKVGVGTKFAIEVPIKLASSPPEENRGEKHLNGKAHPQTQNFLRKKDESLKAMSF